MKTQLLIIYSIFCFGLTALAQESSMTVTTGGYFRWSEEWFTHPNFGRGFDESQGYFLQRYLAHVDMKDKNSGVRYYFQAKYSEIDNKYGPLSPVDRDRGDVAQAFFENKYVRIGRQETPMGSGLLIGIREGANSRLSFDGAKVFSKSGPQWELFVGHEIELEPGLLDDYSDDALVSYLYFTSLLKSGSTQGDLYLVYYEAAPRLFTLGSRLQVKNESVDWDTDFMLQGGTFNDKDVEAYGIASRLKVPLGNFDGTFVASYFSGDKDSSDDKYNTFNALYPKGQYYSWSAEIGHPNLIALQPGFIWHLSPALAWANSIAWFWRENIHDGVYRGSGALLRAPTNEERFIATHLNSSAEWKINSLFSLYFEYTYAVAGDFIRESTNSDDSQFFALRTALRW
jgi:hypothetical protein